MDPQEEKQIIEEIMKQRRLPYSIEIVEDQRDKITVRTGFGSTITYFKKDDKYFLEEELA
jgi:hypothetical protein